MKLHDIELTSLLRTWRICTSILLMTIGTRRFRGLRSVSIKVKKSRQADVKKILCVALAALSVLCCTFNIDHSVLEPIAFTGLYILSATEERHSVRPSTMVEIFLLASFCGDVAEVIDASRSTVVIWIRLWTTLCSLAIESQNKRQRLLHDHAKLSPYATSGFINRSIFGWLHQTLVHGDPIAGLVDMTLPADLTTRSASRTMSSSWSLYRQRRIEATVTRSWLPEVPILVRSLFWATRHPLLAAIPSRIILTCFRYAQPALIAATIDHVNQSQAVSYQIVIATMVIYVGLALSTSIYQHQLDRLKLISRASLTSLLYEKATRLQSADPDNGRILALVSADVDALVPSAEMLHETWAHLLEVIIGMTSLFHLVGWSSPVLLLSIYGCSHVSRYVAKHLHPRQVAWSEATQERLATTSWFLAGLRPIRMIGWTEVVQKKLLRLRDQEMEASLRLRWVMVLYNASANALGIFSPMLVIVLSTVTASLGLFGQSHHLEARTIFTVVAILSMVTHPANMIFTIMPKAISARTSAQRIEAYLNEAEAQALHKIDEESAIPESLPQSTRSRLVQASFAYGLDGANVLHDIDLEIQPGLTVCIGSVGHGKTTLAKAILGELRPKSGTSNHCTGPIGYCAQNAWLPASTVQAAVTGPYGRGEDTTYGSSWYRQVIEACCLEKDISTMPKRDDTDIGNNGSNLSGGQRQRLALARAIYARPHMLVLDDPFSALDKTTEETIMNNLFGIDGLLRRAANSEVFLTTTQVAHCRAADHVVVLHHGRITAQGNWHALSSEIEATRSGFEQVQSLKHAKHTSNTPTLPTRTAVQKRRPPSQEKSQLSTAQQDIRTYGHYIHAMGRMNFTTLLMCTSVYAFFSTVPQYWLKVWADSGDPGSAAFFAVVYATICFLAWASTNGTMWATIIRIAPVSGIFLHSSLLDTVSKARLNDISGADPGSIFNHQDLQVVDRELPGAISAFSTQVFKLTVQLWLLFSARGTFATIIPVYAVVVLAIQRLYLRVSKEVRHQELQSKATVTTSFIDITEGLSTIRAFDWTADCVAHHLSLLEASQHSFFLRMCVERWLNVVLDLIVATLAIGFMASATSANQSLTGSQLGVGLNMILLAATTLVRLVQTWTSLELSLESVQRLASFDSRVRLEGTLQSERMTPAPSWPSEGRLTIKGLQVSYGPDSQALKNVDIAIEPGQSVVISGRTGSGKSTLLQALLQLQVPDKGTILVDGVDVSLVRRSLVRERCFIAIPQDPILSLNDTLRFNLDPEGRADDLQIVSALDATTLWQTLLSQDLPEISASKAFRRSTILDSKLAELSAMTPGRLQLLALSRAIIRTRPRSSSHSHLSPKPIILLDEITSSLDKNTEAIAHNVIKDHFTSKGHTVISISHRVDSAVRALRKGLDLSIQMRDGEIHKVTRL